MFLFKISCLWRFTAWTLIDISHYGFTVDDAPFYYTTYGGEFEIFCSFDDKNHVMMCNAWLQDHIPAQAGLMRACPGEEEST